MGCCYRMDTLVQQKPRVESQPLVAIHGLIAVTYRLPWKLALNTLVLDFDLFTSFPGPTNEYVLGEKYLLED